MNGLAIASEFATTLAQAFGSDCHGVALFGSCARGDARLDSDIDLLLVTRGLPADPFSRGAAVRRPVLYRIEPVSILARTPEEFEADVTPLHLDLALDARVLFEHEGYLSQKLATLRQRINEAGLWRSDDLFWHWHKPPSVKNWEIRWDGVRV